MTLISFQPISYAQYQKDFNTSPLETNHPKCKDESEWFDFWQTNLEPSRATDGSAGYDIYSPFSFSLKPGEEILVPTGTKVCIDQDLNIGLFIFPRSGAGFKCYIRLANTVGVIDKDYQFASNDGHFFIKLRNESVDKEWSVKQGEAFAQGVFLNYYLTDNDAEKEKQIRVGGFGSTDKND